MAFAKLVRHTRTPGNGLPKAADVGNPPEKQSSRSLGNHEVYKILFF